MRRKWLLLLVLLSVILFSLSVLANPEGEITVTVKIKNTNCSEINLSQFLFIKDNSPLRIKRFFPPRTVKYNHLLTLSFELKVNPTHLILSGSQNGDDFSYRIGLNWGINERETSCGRLTVEVPYKGGLNYPVARFDWSPREPKPGESVKFDASKSIGNVKLYGWDFDSDGTVDRWRQDPVIFKRWNSEGQYRVSLTIRDNSGRGSKISNTIEVSAGQPPEPTDLPYIESFTCQEHGYFSQSNREYGYLEDTSHPPHNNCWGHYKAHIYPLEEYFNSPIAVSKITAKVVGGISELRSVRGGFKLQVLPHPNSSWKTLKTFPAPCASGDIGTLVQWGAANGNLERAIALRLTAPAGGNSLFIDNSALWIEYYPLR